MRAAVFGRFSRLAAEASEPEAILPLLADAAIEHGGADAAAVLRVSDDGMLRMAAARELPEALAGLAAEVETIGPELCRDLLSHCGGRYADAQILPLVFNADLFGALVLFYASGSAGRDAQRDVAEGLADLAAIAMGKAAQYAELARSYEALRASREALAQSEKLRALGQMAAGISHDLKNLLNPIGLQLQLLRMRLSKGKDVGTVIEQIESTLKTGVQTIERLRDFSRQRPEGAVEPVAIDDAARAALEICRPRLRMHDALVVREELDAVPTVLMHRTDLVNAIVNLVVNAADAMPSGGTIIVSTGASEQGVCVTVEDDGPGMPPEVAQRVFEPFFTTKAHGTGLGLANIYAFVQRHAGRVDLRTAPGQGTRMTLWFPMPA